MINGLNDIRWAQMRNFIREIQNFCPSNFERVIGLDNMAVDKSEKTKVWCDVQFFEFDDF